MWGIGLRLVSGFYKGSRDPGTRLESSDLSEVELHKKPQIKSKQNRSVSADWADGADPKRALSRKQLDVAKHI